MTNMIERITAAIEDAITSEGMKDIGWVGDREGSMLPVDGKIDLTLIAKCVLGAMREPTDYMTDAGIAPTYEWIDDSPAEVWTRMINAAIADEG